jgi:hypothetical protein
MIASSFLDTAIGIVFVFLLLSIIATTINEIIMSFLNMRGRTLLKGIATLFNEDKSKDLTKGLVNEIYNHGLIFGLFRGDFDPKKGKGDLPSYIPSASFASAFLGILTGATERARANTAAANAVIADASATQVAKDAAQKTIQDAKPLFDAQAAYEAAKKAASDALENAKAASDDANTRLSDPNVAQAVKDSARQSAVAAKATADMAAIQAGAAQFKLLENAARDICGQYGTAGKVLKPLLSLLDSAQGDIDKLKAGIEAWFNSGMDRVSGYYKYNTQRVLLGIGIVLAISLNADTINIIKQISRSDTLRQSLVAAAQKAPRPSENASAQTQNASPSANQAGGGNGQEQDAGPNVTNQFNKVADDISAVKNLGLPVGWGNCAFPTGWWPFVDAKAIPQTRRDCAVEQGAVPPSLEDRAWEGWFALGGWLLTAIGVSLGAPFWFDLLNKFMVVRSTIKPEEKSQQEASKD